ncbi:hypothetical protein EXIGLDRAFT_842647 [Exidia glandulosa HHB12029]|uniref:Uncharacterized protein n=1 Tax=Exidia glandulosa HHB12029 TaxID=1314781 RepID=A0A165D5I4_EXIGL|nr:hypothetical protein EXIGLDRAFT_842647 [Exidia glandulosa HHB12029]
MRPIHIPISGTFITRSPHYTLVLEASLFVVYVISINPLPVLRQTPVRSTSSHLEPVPDVDGYPLEAVTCARPTCSTSRSSAPSRFSHGTQDSPSVASSQNALETRQERLQNPLPLASNQLDARTRSPDFRPAQPASLAHEDNSTGNLILDIFYPLLARLPGPYPHSSPVLQRDFDAYTMGALLRTLTRRVDCALNSSCPASRACAVTSECCQSATMDAYRPPPSQVFTARVRTRLDIHRVVQPFARLLTGPALESELDASTKYPLSRKSTLRVDRALGAMLAKTLSAPSRTARLPLFTTV